MSELVTDVGDVLGNDVATFSADRAYRYSLSRVWDGGSGIAVWVMLNPSTADAFVLDPTLRRCKGFAQSWGLGGMSILNLFALRATDPKVMLAHPDPVGGHNDAEITRAARIQGALWIAGWGPTGTHMGRDRAVTELLAGHGVQLHTVKPTRRGHPGHPLYVPADRRPVPWSPADERTENAA